MEYRYEVLMSGKVVFETNDLDEAYAVWEALWPAVDITGKDTEIWDNQESEGIDLYFGG